MTFPYTHTTKTFLKKKVKIMDCSEGKKVKNGTWIV